MPNATKASDKEAIEWLNERFERNKFPDYATNDFWEAVQMWNDWKLFGFPNAGGTLDQPCLWFDIMRIFQSCAKRMEV